MILDGVDFGTVLGASGVQGFFGEGYWFHRWLRLLGLSFKGITFVAKTTTFFEREGNMPQRRDGFRPRERFPKCVKIRPLQGVMLNSVGLSGPGAKELLAKGYWQSRTEPFMLSFMSVADDPGLRAEELARFVYLLQRERRYFKSPFGLQINFSCPNVGLDTMHLVDEVGQALDIANVLGIPLMPKFNLMLPVEVAREIEQHRACAGICMTNTLPWGTFPKDINWEKLFGTKTSPLVHLGGGGLSGKPLQPLLVDWLWRAREVGIKKPINAGGGILSLRNAREVMGVLRPGVDSIFLGSIAVLRPWCVQRIIRAMT